MLSADITRVPAMAPKMLAWPWSLYSFSWWVLHKDTSTLFLPGRLCQGLTALTSLNEESILKQHWKALFKRSQTTSNELHLDGFLHHPSMQGSHPRTAGLLPAQDETSCFLSLGNLISCSMLSASSLSPPAPACLLSYSLSCHVFDLC